MEQTETTEVGTEVNTPGTPSTPAATAPGDIRDDMAAFARSRLATTPEARPAPTDPVETVQTPRADTSQDVKTSMDSPVKESKTEPGPVPYPAFKTKVDKLTRRAETYSRQLDQERLERQRFQAGFELLQKEYDSLVGQLKQDPKDAELQQLKLQRHAEQRNHEITSQWEQSRQAALKAENEAEENETLINTLVEDATAAARDFPDVVSPTEILQLQRHNPGLTATDAARHLYERREKAFLAKTSKSKAPQTLTRSSPVSVGSHFNGGGDIEIRDQMVAFANARNTSRV